MPHLLLRRVLLLAGLLLGASSADAQTDLTGNWGARLHEDFAERVLGPPIGAYEGIPLNAEGRLRAESWSPSLWSVPEHQCIPHPADYGPNYSSVRISAVIDPVTRALIAYQTEIAWMNAVRTIWMDGRPHPPAYAPHTWQGFSTGRWDGDVLTVETTHLKAGYLRRNGVPRSPNALLREHIVRHGDVLTWISIVTDPVYLTEPFIRSRNFAAEPGLQVVRYPCSVEVEIEELTTSVPHYLPGANPFLTEHATAMDLPADGVRGGAETMYPEFLYRPSATVGSTRPAKRR
jgi:hypothetical protein